MPSYGALQSPARSAKDVTPSGSDVTLTNESRLILIGGAGTLKVDMAGTGAGITMTVQAGQELPIAVSQIYNTGTTATGIVAFW